MKHVLKTRGFWIAFLVTTLMLVLGSFFYWAGQVYKVGERVYVFDKFAKSGGQIAAHFELCKLKDANMVASLVLWQEKALQRTFAPQVISDVNYCISPKSPAILILKWDIPCNFPPGDYKAALNIVTRGRHWYNQEKTIYNDNIVNIRADECRN